ncbi:MAG: redoxin domain-containing protein [Mesorhizobium sp.]
MRHSTPMPSEKAPDLKVDVLGGEPLDLAHTRPKKLSLLLFYRGVHCPICRRELEELNLKQQEFTKAGIKVHAVSMDSRERAERQKRDWAIGDLAIGYGLDEASARDWGLFISGKAKDTEPERFAEPGIAIIDPEGHIYALFLQSVPFARPTLDGLLQGLKFVLENNYPTRGKLTASPDKSSPTDLPAAGAPAPGNLEVSRVTRTKN